MIQKSWCKLLYSGKGYNRGGSIKASPINEILCDLCPIVYLEKDKDTKIRREKWGKDLCGKCGKCENSKAFGLIGAKTLSSIKKEDRKKYSSEAGKISHIKSPNNSGKFSKERWDNLTEQQQQNRVKNASKALYDKLDSDENLKREHYLKIFKNSKIGFTSKGHNELHGFLKDFGFQQHFIISDMEVDEYNIELKIVVEFNGDMYHCNPRKWKPDDFNKVIKMHAKEKWEKDRNRYYKLKNMGNISFVVWEDDWALKRDEIKNKLTKFINKRKNEIIKN